MKPEEERQGAEITMITVGDEEEDAGDEKQFQNFCSKYNTLFVAH